MIKSRFQRSRFDAQLVARALNENSFRSRFVENPRGVYDEELQSAMPNHTIPEGVEIRIVEEAENVFYVVLPYIPSEMNLSNEALARVARHEQTHRKPCWGLRDSPE